MDDKPKYPDPRAFSSDDDKPNKEYPNPRTFSSNVEKVFYQTLITIGVAVEDGVIAGDVSKAIGDKVIGEIRAAFRVKKI